MILILLLDGTAEIQSLGWKRGWPLCGPAAPCTSLLGCSSSFGILRKQAAFLQDEDLACHYGFPEVGGRDKKGVYLGVRVGRKKECLTFYRNSMDLRFPQGVKGIKNSSGCFLRSPPPPEEEFPSTLSCPTPVTVTSRAFKGWLPFAVELSVL